MSSARRYFDPEGFDSELLADPFERAAVALWLCSWNTPEDAGQTLGRDGGEHAWKLWARLRESDRHLYRRRAALALDGVV